MTTIANNNIHISRYMTFDRFVDICRSGLFIPNASIFDDKWEGHIAIRSFASDLSEASLKNIGIMKTHFFISSWYAGDEESAAMWKLYGKDSNAVCVETSMDKLKNVCKKYCQTNKEHNMIIGIIQYSIPGSNDLEDKKPIWKWDYWTEDSVGKPTSIGTNPYHYCSNNPVNWIDPFGLDKEKPWWKNPEVLVPLGLGVGGLAVGTAGWVTGNPFLGALGYSLSFHAFILGNNNYVGNIFGVTGLGISAWGMFSNIPFINALGLSIAIHGLILTPQRK